MKQKNSKKVRENSKWFTNIVAIDPSTTCTGLCINGEMIAFTKQELAETKTGKLKKWFDVTSEYATIVYVDDRDTSKDYSDEEILKLNFYRKYTDDIMQNIMRCDPTETLIVIEGYSYSSKVGHIIDLVGFSTLLRNKLLDNGFENIKIVSPSSLKLAVAKMSYEPETVYLNKKKTRSKKVWKNTNGVVGGKFKKDDMMQALLDSPHTDSEWKTFLQENLDELSSIKVPKPIEDLNDAFLLYNVYKKGFDE